MNWFFILAGFLMAQFADFAKGADEPVKRKDVICCTGCVVSVVALLTRREEKK